MGIFDSCRKNKKQKTSTETQTDAVDNFTGLPVTGDSTRLPENNTIPNSNTGVEETTAPFDKKDYRKETNHHNCIEPCTTQTNTTITNNAGIESLSEVWKKINEIKDAHNNISQDTHNIAMHTPDQSSSNAIPLSGDNNSD